jgi:hypothetical protein
MTTSILKPIAAVFSLGVNSRAELVPPPGLTPGTPVCIPCKATPKIFVLGFVLLAHNHVKIGTQSRLKVWSELFLVLWRVLA